MRKNQELKSRRFDVPQELLGQFFTIVDASAVGSEVEELTEDGELVVRIEYDSDDQEDAMTMIELIKDNIINTKLVNGLTAIGLNADDYLLHLSDTIFKLFGIGDDKSG